MERGGHHFQNCTANNYEYSTAKILFKLDGVGIWTNGKQPCHQRPGLTNNSQKLMKACKWL
jgi:hypothetical protein